MSAPLTISRDELREQENFNYSAIDQYWEEQGYTEAHIRTQYKLLIALTSVNVLGGFILYYAAWLSRKKMSVMKLLGEEPMNGWEKFCHQFKLGQTPAINFVSSCLITNDRVFILLRVVLAIWSLVITLYTWAGQRSIFFGSYYPLATIITIYVSRHRHLIVEGFGKKMQFLNKLLEWLFSLQTPFRLFMATTWWTKWFGLCRYRDMMKPLNLKRAILFQSEFCPMIFLLTEMLWFDTAFEFHSCLHSVVLIGTLCLNLYRIQFSPNGQTTEPQTIVHGKESPAASVPIYWLTIYAYPLSGILLVLFYKTKMLIFSKINLIKDRLEIRTKCIEIFKKRQILNKFLPKEKLDGRKTAMRSNYSTIGRKSVNRQSVARRTKLGAS